MKAKETVAARTRRVVRTTMIERMTPRTELEHLELTVRRLETAGRAVDAMLEVIRKSGDHYLVLLAADCGSALRRAVLAEADARS